MKRSSRKYLLLITLPLCLVLAYVHYRLQSKAVPVETNPMTILLWTKWCGKDSYPYFAEDLVDKTCPYPCTFTRNRDRIYASGAVLFHGKDIKDMPSYRTQEQIWIFFSLEPPTHTPVQDIERWNGIFNLTVTYRLDSDVPTRYGYTFLRRRSRPRRLKQTTKTGFAAWMVSNCKTQSHREVYVKELRKTVPVDVYGRCGQLSCEPKGSDKCYEEIARNYSFYLAFENSLCRDYVTEKFYRPLKYDVVPVVLGGANYSALAPPMSYISALDFRSPEELGKFLLSVAGNTRSYTSYLKWKERYQLRYENLACKLCTKLHQLHHVGAKFSYQNFRQWFHEDAGCTSWENL